MLTNKFLDGVIKGIAILVNLGFRVDLDLHLVWLNIPFMDLLGKQWKFIGSLKSRKIC